MAFYAGVWKNQRFVIPLTEARVYGEAVPAAIASEQERIGRGGMPRKLTPEVVREIGRDTDRERSPPRATCASPGNIGVGHGSPSRGPYVTRASAS